MRCAACGHDNQERASICDSCGRELTESDDSTEVDIATAASLSHDFVGRHREIGELLAALDGARAGRGGLVMLAGEPGIGKTRTLQEFAALAWERGARVIWSVSYEEEGTPPYWPWVQALRSYIREADAETLSSQMGPGAAEIAELVSDVRVKLPHLEPLPALDDPHQARFRLFDSITSFLRSASKTQPLVVVLEDLHWSDKPSLVLLEFIAREVDLARLLLVGTYREVELSRQHPLSQTLAELIRATQFRQVVLKGLDSEEMADLIQITTGTEPHPELVRAIADRTEGNPFFVTEVVRLLSEEGELTSEAPGRTQRWGGLIPQGVRLLVGRRLDHLSKDCNQVLTIAAVVGREFELRHIDALMEEMTEGMVLDALEEALTARVIEEMRAKVGRYQFTHALIQETVTEDLSLTRRVRLHARIADTLESLYGDRAEDQAAELAYHFAQAETVLGTEKLFKYSLIAGSKAFDTHAYEDAEAVYETALAAAELGQMDDEVAALLTGLGKAQGAALKWSEAKENLTRAFEHYDTVGQTAKALDIAMFPDTESLARGLTGVLPMLERALELAAPESRNMGRILCTYGTFVARDARDYGAASKAFQRALEIARRDQDAQLEMFALIDWGQVDFWYAKNCDSLERSLKGGELARRLEDPRREAFAQLHIAFGYLLCKGNLDNAQKAARDSLKAAQRSRDPFRSPTSLLLNGIMAHLAGRLDEALAFHDQALELAEDGPILWSAAMAALTAGRYEKADLHIGRFMDRMGGVASDRGASWEKAFSAQCVATSGWMRGDEEGFETAEVAAREAINEKPIPHWLSNSLPAIALVVVARGDTEGIRWTYDKTKEQFELLPRAGAFTDTNQLLGTLAAALDRLDAAEAHFRESLEFCEKGGFRTDLGWALYGYGDVLLKRDGPGDRERAAELLDRAVSLSREIGMPPLMEKASELQRAAASLPAKRPTYPDGLTQREVEVLRQVAAGKSNREIAEELFISINTVLRHVNSIFGKTAAANRVAAATYARENGLLSDSD